MWTCHGDYGLYDLMLIQQMVLVIGMKLSLPINTEDLMIVWDHEKLLYYRGDLSSLYMFSFQVVFEISECIILCLFC